MVVMLDLALVLVLVSSEVGVTTNHDPMNQQWYVMAEVMVVEAMLDCCFVGRDSPTLLDHLIGERVRETLESVAKDGGGDGDDSYDKWIIDDSMRRIEEGDDRN